MIPRYRPSMPWSELRYLLNAGPGDPSVLEQRWADIYGYPHVVWFPYGRVAVRAFLETLPVNHAQVVLSPFNCVALGNAVIAAGWRPSYVDTGADFNQDPQAFVAALNRSEVQTGIAVSLWGIPSELDAFWKTTKPILFDYALRGFDTQSAPLRDQDAAMYSLNWGKPLGSLRGAMLCGRSSNSSTRWRQWRDQNVQPGSGYQELFDVLVIKIAFSRALFGGTVRIATRTSWANKLSGETAAAGQLMPADWNLICSQGVFSISLKHLEHLRENQQIRARQIRYYQTHLSRIPEDILQLPPEVPGLSHYPLRTVRRDALHAELLRTGIFTSHQLFGQLLSDYSWLKGDSSTDLSRARRLTQTTLHLPLFDDLKESEQEKICNAVAAFLRS